ncbi:hypothetical protein SXCC_03434 [Gluconacetobacter sp. SXCC-1]|nr:hypothetical protein SXCC_03434 [Gluconacetobacter sp. SXCC-1]
MMRNIPGARIEVLTFATRNLHITATSVFCFWRASRYARFPRG